MIYLTLFAKTSCERIPWHHKTEYKQAPITFVCNGNAKLTSIGSPGVNIYTFENSIPITKVAIFLLFVRKIVIYNFILYGTR